MVEVALTKQKLFTVVGSSTKLNTKHADGEGSDRQGEHE